MRKLMGLLLILLISSVLSTETFAGWAVSIRKYPNSYVQSLKKTNDGNYILLAHHHGDFWVLKLNGNGNILWQKTYGLFNEYNRELDDIPHSIEPTSDGGYVMVGNSGRNRTWIVKIDGIGSIEWQKIGNYHSFGLGDYGTDIKQTADGGYVIADQPSEFGADDFGLMKLNSDGSFDWRGVYGANDWQHLRTVETTPDDGFIISGDEGYSSDRNLWIVKVDSAGLVQWQKKYVSDSVGSRDHHAIAKNTSDGGFIVAGHTTTAGSYGNDAWILKLDSNGQIIWQKRYYSTTTGSGQEHVYDIEQTYDGGYVFVGKTDDYNGQRSSKIWLVKIDKDGIIEWDKVYYGGGLFAHSIEQTVDGGYLIGGGRKHPSTTVYTDIFIMKVNADGNIPNCSLHMEEGANAVDMNGQAIDTQFYQRVITAPSVIDTDAIPITSAANSAYVCEISNTPPNAYAGDDLIITSEEATSTVINGIASDSDLGDFLQYRWFYDGIEIQGWLPVSATGECPLALNSFSTSLGDHLLRLEVTDGQEYSFDEMNLVIGNTAPSIVLSGGGVYEYNSPIYFDATVSDFDGDGITYKWKEGSNLLCEGSIETIAGGEPVYLNSCLVDTLPFGQHVITLEVFDSVNYTSDNVFVEIVDTTQPTLAPVINQNLLWPPNHKMVDIVINANAYDNSGGSLIYSAEVFSNEPENDLGDGDAYPDWSAIEIDQENGIITLQLRAERCGTGNGREYTIRLSVEDSMANSSTTDIKVIVPHDKRKK